MILDLSKLFDLQGRTAAITGAGGELCGMMAEALAALGVRVAILDIPAEKARAREAAIAERGGSARFFQCNVLSPAELETCFEEIGALWGDRRNGGSEGILLSLLLRKRFSVI